MNCLNSSVLFSLWLFVMLLSFNNWFWKELILFFEVADNGIKSFWEFELLKISGQHKLRFAIAVSNKDKQNCTDILYLLKQFNPILLKFYNDCIKNEVIPYFDCCSFPVCIMTDDLKKAQIKIIQLQKKYNIHNNILGNPCSLKVDILPDLTAIRSICYPNYEKVSIFDFKSITSLTNYFYNNIDVYHNLLFISDKCKRCKYRLLGQCNMCFALTLNKFQNFKDYILSK